jgi:hypothetical protein
LLGWIVLKSKQNVQPKVGLVSICIAALTLGKENDAAQALT